MKLEIIALLICTIMGRTRRKTRLTSGKKPSYTLGNLVELSN